MKTVLLSFLLMLSASTLFAQVRPGYPCPISIKSNQGGGDCRQCVSTSEPGQQPNVPGADFSNGTATVVLNFGPNPGLTCIPRLIRIIDKNGEFRDILCGLGNEKKDGNNDVIIEYCLFGDNNENFFNQPDLIAVLSYECGTAEAVFVACTSGGEEAPLPVNFSSFNAVRSNSSTVSITWTTAMEQSNKGFNIQKNVAGEWRTIAFVPSQAQDGTSSSALNYSYTDANTEKGITQYRIQQVDLNGKFAYTDIRAIRGDGNLAKVVVYPNPSSDGKVNIVFEDNTALRDVIVNDMQGKAIRSFKGISNNILTIEKLTTGFYTIKVTNRTTNASSVHKLVIK